MPGSPKRKKSKRKASDSDPKAPEGKAALAKRARAQSQSIIDEVDDSQQLRRTGRQGAGTGGRSTQLEKVSAILHAPARTSTPKAATSLDPDAPENPLAPKPPRKGGGSRPKKRQQPPPPYSPSEEPSTTTSKSHSKKNKAPVIPAPMFELLNSQPTFTQREAHGRYRFSPPIVPPGTEPDLQALNNSFVAAAKGAHALPDPNHSQTCVDTSQCHVPVTNPKAPQGHRTVTTSNVEQTHQTRVDTSQRHVPITNPNAPQGHRTIPTSNVEQTRVDTSQRHVPVINPNAPQGHRTVTTSNVKDPALSSTTSNTVLLSDANFFQNLDPALRPTGPSGAESEQSNTSKDDSSGSDEGSGDEEMGWGEARGHHSTHPGFSREELPPQPRVATALPTDFEFQYSRDESDQVAEKTLAVGSDSGDDSSTMDQEVQARLFVGPNDVLKLHHERNSHPRLPDPALLELLRAAEIDTSNSKVKQKGPRLPNWAFLEDAKVECRAQQALENPFPSLVDDLPVAITESLSASLVQWLKNGQQVDAGVWPTHKPDMARLLYDDLATWRSDLKKIAISITPSAYGLSPPDDIPVQVRAAWVQAAAVELLDDGKFMRHGLDEFGKTKNFAHPALLEAIILFFYTGSYRIARRRPAIFRKEVPLTCLALVCTVFDCVFQGLEKNGNGKFYSKFAAKEYESVYLWLLGLLNDVMSDPYHGPKLVQQLREWAKIGWAEASKLDGVDTSKHRHLRVQLD
ncbi:hypothetical protein DEU56DRAFT_760851 [Suillus clintonianus]|uniref:uncharacterized protein n=1 Tax=Suillus clintonianus TaxID=1904413 RepID=UPI001B87CB0B|nr:uncharacterized protein DEU56DRAFT_760851 [Suillus clintonianus]KAG2120255.1 hypothetical protein DEU56DRAFT_760851 [Suillus clintonianus]